MEVYPLVNIQKAIENMAHWFIVDIPNENGGSFHSYVNVYQRVFNIAMERSTIFYR